MSGEWNNPELAEEYAKKLDQVDWYEHEVNMPSLEAMLPAPGARVLDFGSGPGQFTHKLSQKYQVVGADSSPAMISIAGQAYPHILFRQWDGAAAYPVPDETFDAIFSKITIHFISDLGLLSQMCRPILNENGSIVISGPHPIRTIPLVDGAYESVNTYTGTIGRYGLQVQMIHRSFQQTIRPFLDNGFVLSAIDEPLPSAKQAREHDLPDEDMHIPKRLNLKFTKK